ncbi:MAG: DUF4894 domain-containing protein [Thermotogae bacterium]|nr:DUF4894 domain-containing protein [Thermotogota bacterium]
MNESVRFQNVTRVLMITLLLVGTYSLFEGFKTYGTFFDSKNQGSFIVYQDGVYLLIDEEGRVVGTEMNIGVDEVVFHGVTWNLIKDYYKVAKDDLDNMKKFLNVYSDVLSHVSDVDLNARKIYVTGGKTVAFAEWEVAFEHSEVVKRCILEPGIKEKYWIFGDGKVLKER